MKIKTVAIMGAGALGSYFVWGLLPKLKDDLCIIEVAERRESLMKEGMWINGDNYRPVIKTAEEAHGVDLLLVATKYTALRSVTEDIKKIVDDHTIIMSLLNGVDSEQIIGEAVGMERILYSVMRIVSERKENQVCFNAEAAEGLCFGEKDSKEPTERVNAVLEVFEGSRLKYRFVPDILANQWQKYATNIARHLPQSILGIGAGAFTDSEHMEFLSRGLWDEVRAVAGKRGISLEPYPFHDKPVAKKSARFSMLQDIDAGRKTEIDMFAGVLMQMAKEAGISVPYCTFGYHAVKVIEEKNEKKFDY